jgi:hypothetical protein
MKVGGREKLVIYFQPSSVGGKQMAKAFGHRNRLSRLDQSRLELVEDFPKRRFNIYRYQSDLALTGSNRGGRIDDTE